MEGASGGGRERGKEGGWQRTDLETLLPRRPLEGPKAAADSQLIPSG